MLFRSSHLLIDDISSLFLSYLIKIKTSSLDFFKEGFELLPLLEEHRANTVWGQFTSDLLDNNKFQWPKPGNHDDQAHPPIHPLKSIELNELPDPDEKKIYELVTIHFLACCAQDARGLNIFDISLFAVSFVNASIKLLSFIYSLIHKNLLFLSFYAIVVMKC